MDASMNGATVRVFAELRITVGYDESDRPQFVLYVREYRETTLDRGALHILWMLMARPGKVVPFGELGKAIRRSKDERRRRHVVHEYTRRIKEVLDDLVVPATIANCNNYGCALCELDRAETG